MTQVTSPCIVVVDSAGVPYANAKMYTYRAGTTTPLTTYSSATFGIPNANPIIASATGVFAPLYINPALGYDLRIVIKTSSDVLIAGWDIDNIPRSDIALSSLSVSGTATFNSTVTALGQVKAPTLKSESDNPRIILKESDATTDRGMYDMNVDSYALSLRTRTDADGAGKNIIVATRSTGTSISAIAYGDSVDNPAHTFNGAVTATSITSGTKSLLPDYFIYKTADESRSSNTIYTADTHLTLTLPVATYFFDICLVVAEAVSASSGIKARLLGTAVTADSSGSSIGHVNGAVTTGVFSGTYTNGTIGTAQSFIKWSGMIRVTTAGTQIIEWAQNSSSANATTIYKGSYMQFKRVA